MSDPKAPDPESVATCPNCGKPTARTLECLHCDKVGCPECFDEVKSLHGTCVYTLCKPCHDQEDDNIATSWAY